jgi:hypothetical protein
MSEKIIMEQRSAVHYKIQEDQIEGPKPLPALEGKSLFVFGPDNFIRKKA